MPPSHKHPQRALLLLPPAPAPPTYAALKAAYNAPIFAVFRALARSPQRTQEPSVLDIALPCPHLYGHLNEPRGPLYATTQRQVAELYKLISIIAAKESIDGEDAEGIDARVVLIAYPRNGKLAQPSEEASAEEELQGPAIELRTLAQSHRAWDAVYSVECEEGEGLLQNFVSFSPSKTEISRVRGGIVQVEMPESTAAPPESTNALTNHLAVAVGGTFDHLHIGHKLLLTMFAFVLGRKSSSAIDHGPSSLTIGITGDALLKNKKFAEHLESWQTRQQAVHDFLSSLVYFGHPDDQGIHTEEKSEPGPNGHAVHVTYPFGLIIKYVEIGDPFGPTITDESISALAISLETRSGGTAVNTKRAEKGWEPLEVFEVAVLDASEEENVDETFQSKLSSTEIRRLRSEQGKPKGHA